MGFWHFESFEPKKTKKSGLRELMKIKKDKKEIIKKEVEAREKAGKK